MPTTLLPATRRALTRRLAQEQARKRVPSIIAGLVRDGETIWVDSRGSVGETAPTADTQYRIGSITKSMVAVLVMRLRDEGRLALSDRLDDHVPGTAVGDRQIWQLLSHTSGLSSEPNGSWWERSPGAEAEQFVAGVDHREVRPEPRHVFHYSNTAFGLLGELVARHRGHDWMEVLRDEVLAPLGMRRTGEHPAEPCAQGWSVHPFADVLQSEPAHDAGAMAPAGQLWSTVDDMVRWARFLAGDTGEVVRPDTLAEMRVPASVDDGDEWSAGFGLGLQQIRRDGRRLTGHGGSMPGFLATVLADPADNSGVVFMANTTSGVSGALAGDLLAVLDEHEPRIPEEWRPDPSVDPELLALTGLWYWGPAPHLLRILPGGMLDLSAWDGPGRSSRFVRDGDAWVGLDGYHRGEPLRIGRTTDGTVTHLDLNTFILSRTPYAPEAPIPGGVQPWR